MEAIKKIQWHLQRIPFFQHATEAQLTNLALDIEYLELKARKVVYLPGDSGDSLFFVGSGRVKVSRVTRDGKALTLGYRLAGDLFGESALAELGPRQEMAESSAASILLACPANALSSFLKENSQCAFLVAQYLANRTHVFGHKLETLIYRDVPDKLAECLLDLASIHGQDDARGTRIAIKITHQELANLVGATRETVSLTLAQFKKKNLIDNDGRQIIIASSEGLEAML